MDLLSVILVLVGFILVLFIIYAAFRHLQEKKLLLPVMIGLLVVFIGLYVVGKAEPDTRPTTPTIAITEPATTVTEAPATTAATVPPTTQPQPVVQTQPPPETTEPEETEGSSYLSGSWDNKYKRNGNTSSSFELDDILYDCQGFSLDYMILSVKKGTIKDGSQFKVFVRDTSGDWIGVTTFKLTNHMATVDIQFDEKIDVESVAVVCYQASNYEFSYAFGVYDPI